MLKEKIIHVLNYLKGKVYLWKFRKAYTYTGLDEVKDKGYIKGRNKEKKYIVYRFDADCGVGIMSVAKDIIGCLDWADTMDLIPIVLWDLSENLLKRAAPFGECNHWEDCFVGEVTKEELNDLVGEYDIYIEKLNGGCTNYIWDTSLLRVSDILRIRNLANPRFGSYIGRVCSKYMRYSHDVARRIRSETERLDLQDYNVIAVVLREEFSLDESLLSEPRKSALMKHPHGYTIEDVAKQIRKEMEKTGIEKIFVATLVQDSIDCLISEFGKENVLFIDRERETINDAIIKVQSWDIDRNKNIAYCSEIAMAAKCRALLAHISSGSRIAIALNGGKYEDIVLMDYNDRMGFRY